MRNAIPEDVTCQSARNVVYQNATYGAPKWEEHIVFHFVQSGGSKLSLALVALTSA